MYNERPLHEYLNDLAARSPAPGGGSASALVGAIGVALMSMVANYTATMKKRNSDDFTPGGTNYKRPSRAVIAYCNLIKKQFKKSRPIVLGGMEASLRRIAHYDYWTDSVKRSILFDAKADILIYGMGEKTTLELASRLKEGKDHTGVRGICYISKECLEQR